MLTVSKQYFASSGLQTDLGLLNTGLYYRHDFPPAHSYRSCLGLHCCAMRARLQWKILCLLHWRSDLRIFFARVDRCWYFDELQGVSGDDFTPIN